MNNKEKFIKEMSYKGFEKDVPKFVWEEIEKGVDIKLLKEAVKPHHSLDEIMKVYNDFSIVDGEIIFPYYYNKNVNNFSILLKVKDLLEKNQLTSENVDKFYSYYNKIGYVEVAVSLIDCSLDQNSIDGLLKFTNNCEVLMSFLSGVEKGKRYGDLIKIIKEINSYRLQIFAIKFNYNTENYSIMLKLLRLCDKELGDCSGGDSSYYYNKAKQYLNAISKGITETQLSFIEGPSGSYEYSLLPKLTEFLFSHNGINNIDLLTKIRDIVVIYKYNNTLWSSFYDWASSGVDSDKLRKRIEIIKWFVEFYDEVTIHDFVDSLVLWIEKEINLETIKSYFKKDSSVRSLRYIAEAIAVGISDDVLKDYILRLSNENSSGNEKELIKCYTSNLTKEQIDYLLSKKLYYSNFEQGRIGFENGLSTEQVDAYYNDNYNVSEQEIIRRALEDGLSCEKAHFVYTCEEYPYFGRSIIMPKAAALFIEGLDYDEVKNFVINSTRRFRYDSNFNIDVYYETFLEKYKDNIIANKVNELMKFF